MPQDDLQDRRPEARIRDLTAKFSEAYCAGHRDLARTLDKERMDLIRSRSAVQTERMEKEQGIFRG
jgi:hypothetical protein